MVEDRADIPDPAHPNGFWEIIDPKLIENMPADVLVHCWLKADSAFGDRLSSIRSALQEMKAETGVSDPGTLALESEEVRDEDWCVEISQTCAGQNLAVKGFRELLLQGKIVIEESGLAMWCLSNAVEIMNNYGDVKLNKKSQKDTQRIDPGAATMNALALALIRRNNPTLSDRLEDQDWSM